MDKVGAIRALGADLRLTSAKGILEAVFKQVGAIRALGAVFELIGSIRALGAAFLIVDVA